MIYAYDKYNKTIKPVSMPKLKGDDAKRIEDAKVPTAFLKSIMAIKLNVVQS